MRVGLFGGSFSPIHIGHMALANYLCEYGGIDELWFMVSPRNPLKDDATLLPDDLRLKLVTMAIRGYSRMRVCDVEFRMPRPSYTVHTLSELHRLYPQHRFSLIIGSDNWALFPQWHDGEEILRTTPIIIYPRPEHPVDRATLPAGVTLLDAPTFQISSTFIRKALAEGRDIRFLLPPGVYKALKTSDNK